DDDTIVRGLLGDYLASAGAEVEKVEAAIAAADARAIAFAAHKLKSSSRSVGAVPFGELCARLESVAKAGDCAAAAGLGDDFSRQWAAVRDAVSAALGKAAP
ncbi:MAG TPA: Hpt domain-containing protein, partial [Gammaproteobacteria bacterium]|nr:Hpt domain-containing protein [Gammaproteobacteria bacterium]